MTSPTLLTYTAIPIGVRWEATDAKLTNRGEPNLMITGDTTPGTITVETDPGRVKVDTYEARASLGYGKLNMLDFNKQEAQKGISIGGSATRELVSEGDRLMDGASPSEIVSSRVQSEAISSRETVTVFMPSAGADINVEKSSADITCHKPNVDIEWDNIEIQHMDYTPYSFDYEMYRRNEMQIEYHGEPDYFPDSAKPLFDIRA